MNTLPELKDGKFKNAALVWKAIDHSLRLQILHLLHQNKQMAVNTIYRTLRLEQTFTCHHLSILQKAGLVSTKREGRFIYYAVNYQSLQQINSIAVELMTQ